MRHEQRAYRPEIRAVDGTDGRRFTAMPLAYEVVDDYGTIWSKGVFDRSVAERMPTLLYGHDWWTVANVLGRAVDYRDTDRGPLVTFELTAFDAHPHTRQVAAQINEGTLVDMSVGFERRRWLGAPTSYGDEPDGPLSEEDQAKGAVERMIEAGWDEASLVVRGAVPGAKVLSGVRMVRLGGARGLLVPHEEAMAAARKVAAGDLTHEEADEYLRLIATEAEPTPDPEPDPEPTDDDETAAAEAEADEALEQLEDE